MKNNEMSPTYKTMPGSSYPFSPEGFTVYEIEAFYREAKDKNEAVHILADCCATYPANMARFLSERGLISGINPSAFKGETERERKAREKAEKVLELAEKGLTTREAAEELEIPLNTVRSIAARNKISFSGNAQKARKQKGETEMEKDNTTYFSDKERNAMLARIEELERELKLARENISSFSADCEELKLQTIKQAEQIRYLKDKLKTAEEDRNLLSGQMEVVQMIFGGGKNY